MQAPLRKKYMPLAEKTDKFPPPPWWRIFALNIDIKSVVLYNVGVSFLQEKNYEKIKL